MKFFKVLFLIIFFVLGIMVARSIDMNWILGGLGGIFLALLMLFIESFIVKKTTREIISFVFGIFIGMIIANLTAFVLSLIPYLEPIKFYIFVFANLVFVYLFSTFTYHKRYEIKVLDLWIGGKKGGSPKILDTSSIIDGRIRDIASTEFFEGKILVPDFVIKELQELSDSKDPIKRAKGRRGLEILEEMQNDPNIEIKLIKYDNEKIKEVDMKIVELAKMQEAKVITTDYNLNKIANLHGVKVVNVNELALKTRPIFLPGEELKIKIIKKGKEPGQGVGYLPDGTMVVTEASSLLLGKNVDCVVTSFLQTQAGRIVFTRLKTEGEKNAKEE